MVRRRLPSLGSAIQCAALRDVVGLQAGDPGRLVEAGAVGRERLVEPAGVGGDEVAVEPALVGDVGQQRVEQHEVGAGVDLRGAAPGPCRPRPRRRRP